jgi:predicted nucleic-acid-binding protein
MMAGTLVDSNVILDVLTEDATSYSWSSSAIERCADEGLLYINPISALMPLWRTCVC